MLSKEIPLGYGVFFFHYLVRENHPPALDKVSFITQPGEKVSIKLVDAGMILLDNLNRY